MMETSRLYAGFSEDDVVHGRGRGMSIHPGNINLRNRVRETFTLYEDADSNGKQSIVGMLVDEVFSHGGKFVRVEDELPLAREEAIKSVRNRFNQERKRKFKGRDAVQGDSHRLQVPIGADPEINTVIGTGSSEQPFGVGGLGYKNFNENHVLIGKGKGISDHPGNARFRNRLIDTFPGYDIADRNGKRSIASSLVKEVLSSGGQFQNIENDQMKEALEEEDAIAYVRRRFNEHRSNLKKQHDNELVDSSGTDPNLLLEGLFNEECGEKTKLLQHLNFLDIDDMGKLVDRGEEIAGDLLSILELAASSDGHGNVDDLLYSDQLRAAFKSLMSSCKKTVKRARKGGVGESNEGSQNPAFADLGTKTVLSNTGSNMESILTGFASALSFKKDTYIDKMDIVAGRVFRKGEHSERKYFGTTLNGLPHGLGVMIYSRKDKWLFGHWRKGKLHGLGGAIYENDHRCFGLFVKEHLHGKAIYKTNESVYIGEYRKHLRHGRGKLVHDIKGTFDGYFHEDRFEGYGVYTAPNGHRSVGDFVDWNFVPNH